MATTTYKVIASVPNSEARKGKTLRPFIMGDGTACWFVTGQTTGWFTNPWDYPHLFKKVKK